MAWPRSVGFIWIGKNNDELFHSDYEEILSYLTEVDSKDVSELRMNFPSNLNVVR